MYGDTESIILSSYNFSDSDKLFKVLSNDYGKIPAIGKGVRKIKSRRSPALDTLNISKLSFYKKDDYYYINQAKLINNFSNIKKNLALSSWAYYILEAVDVLTTDEVEDKRLYNMLKKTLFDLEKKPSKRVVYRFLRNLISYQGFWDELYSRKYPFLKLVYSEESVSGENQEKIDDFFSNKIEEISERKLNSTLLISKI